MNVDRLVAWGEDVLRYVDNPREMPGGPVDRQLLEDRLGCLRAYRKPLSQWSELLALAQTSEHYVRHHGLHAKAVDQLRGQLEPLATCTRSHRMKDAILEFVSQQASHARPGERLIGSTEVLESIIGKYQRLQSMHSKGGMTGMILSVGAIVAQRTRDTVRKALEQVTNSDILQWSREHLGITPQSHRKLALEGNKTRIKKRPVAVPGF